MELPARERVQIEPAKVRDYLLSKEHPVGRFKAAFFESERPSAAAQSNIVYLPSGWFWSMRMKSATRGKPISVVEITNVSKHGFWLLLGERELFLAFEHFPWFRDVSIGQLCNVELPHPHHLYWPDLDVDVAVESIDHPERFPLVSQARPKRMQLPRKKRARA